jgi:hypothetical protein
MARLFPKIDPSEIDNPGERKVAEALVGQLASRVEVFHTPFQVRSATVQHRRHGGVNGRGKGRGQGL